MGLLPSIIFLFVLGSVLLYYSFKEINWYFKKEEQKENFLKYVRESFLKRGYQIISMRKPNKLEKKENPFRSGIGIVLPAFFGTGERSFYWIVCCKDASGNEKEVWAEATQSIYMKPRYKFSPNIV